MGTALFICTTYYHVYVTLLKQLNAPREADLVICDDIPTGRTLAEQIRRAGLFSNVWYVQQSLLPEVRGHSRLDWVVFQHRRRYRTLHPLLPFQVENYQDVYLFHDGTPLGMYLTDARKPYHLIEDSLNFYQRFRETPQARLLKAHTWRFYLRRILNAGYFPLGESRFVIDIEVNDRSKLQIQGKKIVELSRSQLHSNLSPEGLRLLLEVFGCPQMPEMGGYCALLLTEPLYTDGVCGSLQEQVQIYKEMTTQLEQRGFHVVLKPHPRDTASYSHTSATVLERYFPIELLNDSSAFVLGCVAAVSSSAVYSITAKQRLLWKKGVFVNAQKKGGTM